MVESRERTEISPGSRGKPEEPSERPDSENKATATGRGPEGTKPMESDIQEGDERIEDDR